MRFRRQFLAFQLVCTKCVTLIKNALNKMSKTDMEMYATNICLLEEGALHIAVLQFW